MWKHEEESVLTAGQATRKLASSCENVNARRCSGPAPKKGDDEKENTTIINGAARRPTSKHASARSRLQIEETPPTTTRGSSGSLAKLAGGVAIIRVGGATRSGEGAQGSRGRCHARDRGQSRRHSSGRRRFLRASEVLRKSAHRTTTRRPARDRPQGAFQPARRSRQCGEDGSVIVARSMRRIQYASASTPQNGEYVICEQGIIDPTKVVRSALQKRSSVAGLLITTEHGGRKAEEGRWMPAMPGVAMGRMGVWTSKPALTRQTRAGIFPGAFFLFGS